MSRMKPRNLPLFQRGFNFEMIMWFFTRLSALAMHLLILSGIIGALILGARTQMNFADLMRWAFMPSITYVQNANAPDLMPWSKPFWRLLSSAFIFIAAAHGLHGLLSVLDDYFAQPRLRQTFRILILVIFPVICVIGIYVIWTS